MVLERADDLDGGGHRANRIEAPHDPVEMRDITARWDFGAVSISAARRSRPSSSAPATGSAAQARIPTPKDGGPDGVIAAMAEAIRTAAGEAKVETSALDGVGIGSPGEVDPSAGTVTNAYNVVADWNRTIQVGDLLANQLGTRIGLGNDVRVATAAEFELGAGKPYRSLLGVFWGTGVGGGIILNGAAWRGRGAAGEIGHMVVRRNGARCTCGREGCMEAYSGRRAMELEARRRVRSTARRRRCFGSWRRKAGRRSRAGCGPRRSSTTTISRPT